MLFKAKVWNSLEIHCQELTAGFISEDAQGLNYLKSFLLWSVYVTILLL